MDLGAEVVGVCLRFPAGPVCGGRGLPVRPAALRGRDSALPRIRKLRGEGEIRFFFSDLSWGRIRTPVLSPFPQSPGEKSESTTTRLQSIFFLNTLSISAVLSYPALISRGIRPLFSFYRFTVRSGLCPGH